MRTGSQKASRVNSGFNSANQTIIRYQTVDVCVAVAVERIDYPVIWHADYKNLGEISVEVKQLAKRARAGKLKPEEYKVDHLPYPI